MHAFTSQSQLTVHTLEREHPQQYIPLPLSYVLNVKVVFMQETSVIIDCGSSSCL